MHLVGHLVVFSAEYYAFRIRYFFDPMRTRHRTIWTQWEPFISPAGQ